MTREELRAKLLVEFTDMYHARSWCIAMVNRVESGALTLDNSFTRNAQALAAELAAVGRVAQ